MHPHTDMQLDSPGGEIPASEDCSLAPVLRGEGRGEGPAQKPAKLFGRPIPAPSTGKSFRHGGQAVGRNAKCPCDSGKKFKACCLSKLRAEDKQVRLVPKLTLPPPIVPRVTP